MGHLLTNPQNSIWLTEKYFKGTSVNNICGYVYIKDKVNFDMLKKSINELVKTNDVMRFKFKEENGKCIQYENNYKEFDIEIFNFSSESDIEKTALEMANKPFEFENNFVFKFILFKLPNNSGGFIVNVHHIIGDSWSLGLIAKEVTKIYSELLSDTYDEKVFPSYINYIKNEIEYINSEKYLKDKAYWNEIFSTVPETASIPSINDSKNVIHSCNGSREKFIISEKEIIKIKEFCAKNKISVYNFFMAVYSLYLGRVSNLDDFVVGTPILNRTNFEQKHTIGMFISTAPLRINLDQNLSFIDFSQNIAANSMSLLRHQRYSYQSILEDLRKKDASIPNLYNVVLSYQITKTIEEESDIKYTSDWVFNGNCADELQIHLFDLHGEDSITVAYDYKSDKYYPQDIKDLHARILYVINQVIDNNEILLKNIEIVTPEEKNKILCDFNNTAIDYPRDKTIVDLFEEQVEKTPDNIAVVFEEQKLTYKELNEKANYIAAQIVNKNLFNQYVSIICDKSLEMIIGIIAILKSGNAYIPIDPKAPDSRINFIMTSTKSSLLLTTSQYSEKYFEYNVINISLKNNSKANINNSCLNNSAYIIFTSGSTGTPKGVEVLHKNICNTLLWRKSFYGFNSSTRTLQIPSFAFDSSVEDIFTTLISGSCLVMPSTTINDIDSLLNDISKNSISHFLITPALYNILLDNDKCKLINTLKFITIAGESFGIDLIKKHYSVFPSVEIINEYGPTENSVCSTVYKFSKNSSLISIGKPISGAMAYVVSNSNNLCPIGVPGELWVSGNGVSKGYLNNENLTNQKFIKNPFGTGLAYKTGDLVKWLPDGNLDFIGRIDNQVKIRGFRIELSEIDANILTYPNIKQAITIVKDVNNTKSICSYIIADKYIDTNDLKKHLFKNLPNYMVPTYIIQIKNLPLNINGKVDRKLLPLPNINNTKKEKIKPRNKIDNSLLDIAKCILGFNDISIEDNLFDIGMDSLSAITISSKISKELNIQINVKNIFEYPIIKDLSDYIHTCSITEKNICQIPKAPKMKYYPISSAQKRIYYSSILDNNSTLYNIAGGIIIEKILDVDKLQKCFCNLIQRNEALRTHFEISNNEIMQVINENVNYKIDLEISNTDDLNKIYSNFVKPFNLSKAPLFRAKLVKFNKNKMLLLLDMHHIISDGVSLGIFMQELCDLYNNITLPEKQIDYTDFTLWEKEQFNTVEFKNSKKYWLNQFKDEIPLLNMPTCTPRPSVQSFEGANYHTILNEDTFNKISMIAKSLNVTPYMLMLSCYYILLSKYTMQDDIVVGTPIVGRELPELYDMLGMFVNTLAIRSKVNNLINFEEFCKIIKENCLNSFRNQSYPFDMLVKDLNITRDISRNPLFDVMFVYQNNGYPHISFDNIKTEYFIPDNNISKFDLTLEIIPVDNTYHLRFEYCTKLFNEDFVKQLSSHYINILNSILENTSIKIADIDMLSQKEKNQILFDFNTTKTDYPKDKTIIELFEEQVEKTPDNIAIVFENAKLTYKELNEHANKLARFLISNNITIGDKVCILLDKSLEMIISILSILKVGATFLPIDINYPKERIDYIINNSNSKILLTTQNLINKANDTIKVLNIELNNISSLQYSKENLYIKYPSDTLAYVMYTSGSTGNPKGVMVTHKNVLRLVINNKFIKFQPNEHILQTGSIVFDACTFEIWGALLNGFKLYIIEKEKLLDSSYLKDYMYKNKITSLFITTQLFNQLVDSNIEIFSNVKNVLTGGEAVSVKHINKLNLNNENINIIHCYGPTENTTFSTCYNIKKIKYKHTVPIGTPISNSTCYVVSNSGLLCPIGVPGELWVSGDGVAKGYLNNENLTKEKFIPNPFNEGIAYKTGDLVKWLPDGNIEFIGRIDNQVKIRGFRIELNEIDLKILEYPDIKYSTTIINNINNEKVICSYFVAKSNIDINKLKDFLKKSLPNYMIPTYMLQLEKFKMNINGKIDKKTLPTDFRALKRTQIIKKPNNEIEEKLLKIYKSVTNIDEISVTDDLFDDLHGDSLIAMKIQVEALSQKINIAYSDIFKYSSIRSLANNLINNKLSQENDPLVFKDYAKYDEILKKNSLEYPLKIYDTPIKNILLTGATGFLGAHILDSFIKKENGIVYCLIRSKNNITAEERLLNVLHFYFEHKYDKYIGTRIQVVEGDISFDNFGLSIANYQKLGKNISTIIHSAALVKHYGIYKDFESANIIGTKNVVKFATTFNLNLLHVSTLSVSGNNFADGAHVENNFENDITFSENNFYIGQNVEGLYAKSKFEAEHIVLDAIYNSGLKASILRMGNLTSRLSEGKFQQNHFENAFVNRFKSFLQIGYAPDYMLNLYAEFTPIDCCGDAIIEIAKHFNPEYTVYHLMNDKRLYLDNLFDMMRQLNININIVPEQEFINIINNLLADPNKKMYIEGIINDFDKNNKHLIYDSKIKVQCDFTKTYLERLGFSWPNIDINYIRNYFKYLENIGYLNINTK